MIYKLWSQIRILDEDLLFTEFDNHIMLSEAWLSSTGGALSETSAPCPLKFGPKTKEVCITIDFAPWKEFLEENQKLNLSTTDTLSCIWAGSLQHFAMKES